MADVTYESLQSKIETQKAVIRQQKTVGEKGIESIRKVHPRTPPSIWFEKQKPQIKTISGQLSELESAEKKLSEQQQLLESKKAEGYKVRETDEGKIELYKETYTEGERVQVGTRPTSVMVYWINPKTGKTGRFQGRQSQMADYERQLGVTGRQVTKVTTIGGGEPIYEETKGLWTTKDVILWEGSPIIKEPIKTAKEISVYTGIYERIPEGVVKKKMVTPTKFAEARGLPSDVFKEWQSQTVTTTTTRDMTQAEITKLLSTMTRGEKLVWYKEHAEFGVEGEDKKSWSELQKQYPDWELQVRNGDVVVVTPEADRELLLKVMGKQYEETPEGVPRFARAVSIMTLGAYRPEAWVKEYQYRLEGYPMGFGAAVSTFEWEYQISKEKDPFKKWMAVQRPTYEHVILPFVAGAGIGAAFKGIGLAAKTTTGVTSKVLSQFVRKAPYVYGGVISTMVGTDIGYTAAIHKDDFLGGWGSPETVSKIARYGMQFGFAGLGARWARGVSISERQMRTAEQTRLTFNRAMAKIPGYEPIYEQISIFKTTGKYGYLQGISRPPSALYSTVRTRMDLMKQPTQEFIARSALLRQQKLVSKQYIEPPIGMEQRYRLHAIRSPYTMVGDVRIQPRVGYALSAEAIARIAPTGGYRIRPSVEMMPKVFETTDLIFTKKVPVEGGYLLEYVQKTDIHYKPFTKRLPYEYETMKGFGRIFKPDMPGEYTIGGKKIFIGAREAYDIFAGKKILLRTFGGKAEQLGLTQAVYAESKIQIPKQLWIKADIKQFPIVKRGIPYLEKRGLPDFEKLFTTKTIQNINQEYYNFFSATKQTGMPGKTSLTVGLGRTQELFTIHSPLKAFKLVVSRYVTVGDVTPIKDVTLLPGKTIPVRGAGKIYDMTEWYGTDYMKTPVSSYHMNIFTQLKTVKASQIVSTADLESAQKQFYVPSARQLPIPRPSGQVAAVKTYAAVSPYIIPITRVSPVSVSDVILTPRYDTRLGQKILTDQLEMETIRPMMKLEEETITRQLERQITKPMTRQIERTITKPMVRQIERVVTKPMTRQIIKPMTRQIEKLLPKLEEKQITKQATKLLEKQMLKQMMKLMVKTTTIFIPSIYPYPYPDITKVVTTPSPPPPPPPPFIFGALPDTPYKLFGHTTGQGYNVKIKERHIVKGKKIKEPRFIKINKKPLSIKNAKSLMGMALDNSAAASGKIVPVNAMAQEPLIKLKPFEDMSHKFYMKDDVFIEKTKHRIDTRGEVKGISALGWYAEKTAKVAKKKPVVDRRPKARVVRERDMFDTNMDDMLINMNKIFKGASKFGFQ